MEVTLSKIELQSIIPEGEVDWNGSIQCIDQPDFIGQRIYVFE